MSQNLPTQNVTKLKNSQCDQTQKLKMGQNSKSDNSKTKNVTKIKNSKCDKTQKPKM